MKVTPEGLQTLWVSSLPDAPTAIQWLTDNRFLSGFAQKCTMGIFDAEKGSQLLEYDWESKGLCGQVNQVRSNRQLIVAAH